MANIAIIVLGSPKDLNVMKKCIEKKDKFIGNMENDYI